MQKRTNPLELKVDNTAPRRETPAASSFAPIGQQEPTVKVAEPVEIKVETAVLVTEPVEQKMPASSSSPEETTRPPIVKRPIVQATVPAVETEVPKVSESKAAPIPSRMEAMPTAGGEVRWSRMTPVTVQEPEPVVEPEQAQPEELLIEDEPQVVSVTDTYEEIVQEPVEDEPEAVEDIETLDEELIGDEESDTFDAENGISDEAEPLTIDDYMMSARFSLHGRISRGMKISTISRDVCRLAQLMHPEKSLSEILEDALLTRIYLENPDAFDALAEMLEKKGGHIKC